jgi:hypothetical protein
MQPTVRQRPLAAVSRQAASRKRLHTQTIIGQELSTYLGEHVVARARTVKG